MAQPCLLPRVVVRKWRGLAITLLFGHIFSSAQRVELLGAKKSEIK